MEFTRSDSDWYKDAVFYAVITGVFFDSNGDGIGDIQGIIQKLDYLSSLGVTCLWLLPFYPTTDRDDGYDVTDHKAIDPQYGDLDDFKQLLREAKERDLKVIIDLVVHHTSDHHPWFEMSAKEPNSIYRDYYIWSDKIPDEKQVASSFPGVEAGVWTFHPVAKMFYYHSFYHFEPDLNIANPAVQKEIVEIMNYWLDLGVDGFRMDAATLMFDKKGIPGTEVHNAPRLMREWRAMVDKKNAIILAEADVTEDKVELFFGDGDRMNLMFNFLLNRYLFLAFARRDSVPISSFLSTLPIPPDDAQWVNFLRNHDELNVGELKPEQMQDIFEEFAPDKGMRIYNRGIRRRLAPMFHGNLDRLKMVYSLMFALPGAVMLLYGDEIGMGDNLAMPERLSVRIPMQWENSVNGGFSSVHPSGLVRDVLQEGEFGYTKVNVAEQMNDPDSLFHHIQNLIQVKRAHPEFGFGTYHLISVVPQQVLAVGYEYKGERVVTLHNLSDVPCKASLIQYEYPSLIEFYSDGNYDSNENANEIDLEGYGFRWFFTKRDDV